MIKYNFKILIFLMFVAFISTGCLKLMKNRNKGDIVAQVGNSTLRRSDVAHMYQGVDSLKLTQTYVNSWIIKKLKAREAETIIDKIGIDIDKMVEEYRNSLLSQRLDQYYIESKVDTAVTVSQIENYYKDNKAQFSLERPLVKGRVVKVQKNFRQLQRLKDLMSLQGGDKQQDFSDICSKNNFPLTVFNTWTDYSDFLDYLPLVHSDDEGKWLVSGKVQSVSDGKYDYLFQISNILPTGTPAPQSMVENEIRRMILKSRVEGIVKQHEDSLYNSALKQEILKLGV